MVELTTTGRLVEGSLGDEGLAAVLARGDLEAALESGTNAQLWLELGLADEDGEDAARLTIDLVPADLEAILSRTDADQIALAFDSDELGSLFDEPDVEAHGLRSAIAIAVTSAAVLAPSSLAAVPQTVESAATTQRVSSAVTSQVSPAARSQVSPAAARTQVARTQVVKSQISTRQVSKTLVLKRHGSQIQRSGLVR